MYYRGFSFHPLLYYWVLTWKNTFMIRWSCHTLNQNCIPYTTKKGKPDFKQVYGVMEKIVWIIWTTSLEERMLSSQQELRMQIDQSEYT